MLNRFVNFSPTSQQQQQHNKESALFILYGWLLYVIGEHLTETQCVLLYIPPYVNRIEWNDYRHQTEQPAAAKVQSQETFWEETSQVSFCLATCVKRLLYASAHSNPQPLYIRTSIILYVIRHYNTCNNHVNTYRDVYRETWRVWDSIEIYFLLFICYSI